MFDTLISTEELHDNRKDNWLIVDCRFELGSPESGEKLYGKSHIPGSVYAHLDRDLSGEIVPGVTGRHPLPDPAQLEAFLRSRGLNQGDQVVAYDQGSGAYASRLWWLLNWLGHSSVAVLDGGFALWNEEGRPLEDKQPQKEEGNFRAQPRPELLITADQLLKSGHTLVDARDEDRFAGKVEPIDPIAGHIPGAINLPFRDNVGPDGKWKDPDKLKKRFENSDLARLSKSPVFYCGSGVTACHDILAYRHAGFEWPLLYAGSWSEWIADRSRPVESE